MNAMRFVAVLFSFSFGSLFVFGQSLQFRADQIQLAPDQFGSAKCVQLGIYMSTSGLGAAQDWQQISLKLTYDDPSNVLAATPMVLRLSPFVGSNQTPVAGIANPGVPLSGSSCSAGSVINQATLGGNAATFMSNGASTSAAGGFEVIDLNTTTKQITMSRLNTSAIFRTNDNTEYLVAIVELAVKANATPSSIVSLNFLPGTGNNFINRSGRESLDATTTNGHLLIFQPINCANAALSDNLGTASGASIEMKWLDPQAGGSGGNIRLTLPHASQDPDQIRILPDDGSGEILLSGNQIGTGSTTLDLTTSGNQTPSAQVASVNYQVFYGLTHPLGGIEEGTFCTLTASWAAPSCTIAFSPTPTLNQPTAADITLTNARYDNAVFGQFTGPNISQGLSTPSSVSGSTLHFDDAYSLGSLALSDLGAYSVALVGPASQSNSCETGIGLACPTNDFNCNNIGTVEIGGSVTLTLAGTNVVSWDIVYGGTTNIAGSSPNYTLSNLRGDRTTLVIRANGFNAQGEACSESVTCNLVFANPTCSNSGHENPTNCPDGLDYGSIYQIVLNTTGALSATTEFGSLSPDFNPKLVNQVSWTQSFTAETSGTLVCTVGGPTGTTSTTCSFELCVIPPVEIPDARFKAFLLHNYDSNRNGYLSPSEAAVPTEMDCSFLGIRNLTGIEAFTALRSLKCNGNNLTGLPDLSGLSQLEKLDCSLNLLESLPNLTGLPNLTELDCSSNRLTGLPVLSSLSQLKSLHCENNGLTELPSLTALTNLTGLNCSNNRLSSLPSLAGLSQLIYLDCGLNGLTSLPDLSSLSGLLFLFCDFNKLTSLPSLSALVNLQFLECSLNRLEGLPDLSALTNLTWLNCNFNLLTALPDLSGNSSLATLDCSFNFLEETSCPVLLNYGELNYWQGNPLVELRPSLPVWPSTNLILTHITSVNGSVYQLNCQ